MNHIYLTIEQAIDLCCELCIDYNNFLVILEKYDFQIPIVDFKYHNSYYIEGETYIFQYGNYEIYYPWELNIIYAMPKYDKE